MAFGKTDDIQIEILPDGTIKTTTDPISGANHAGAEAFLKFLATLAGGDTTITRKSAGHHHHHEGEHQHDKAGH